MCTASLLPGRLPHFIINQSSVPQPPTPMNTIPPSLIATRSVRNFIILTVLALMTAATPNLRAQIMDVDGATFGFGNYTAPTPVWDSATTAIWTTSTNGTNATATWSSLGGGNSSVTEFRTSNSSASSTVTVAENFAVQGLTLSGTRGVTLSASSNRTITLSAGAIIHTPGAGFLTIGDNLTLSGDFTKTGNEFFRLGGNGTLGGAVTVANTGILAPGTSGDATTTLKLNTKNLTLSGIDSKIQLNLTGTADGEFDKIAGIAVFAQGGDITFTLSGSYTSGDFWDVFDFSSNSGTFNSITLAGDYIGTLTPSGGIWTNTDIGGQSWEFDESSGTLSVIPEPATWALLTASLTTVMVLRRRRNS